MEAVVAAKARGIAILDELTKDEPLDYFVAFSSAAAVFGNVGQSDYAFANAFMEHFVDARERRREAGERRGRAFCAAWPVWVDGGMGIDDEAVEAMERVLGMRPLRTAPALDALERALASTHSRLLLTSGHPGRITAALDEGAGRSERRAKEEMTPAARETSAEAMVLSLLAEELKLPASEIVVTEPFERYGVDSLITMSLVRRLEEHCGPLSKTLLFEYVSVRELAEHLASEHPQVFARATASDQPRQAPVPVTKAVETPEAAQTPETSDVPEDEERGSTPAVAETLEVVRGRVVRHDDEIAIIGVAGRFPQADDVHEFWDNLRAGRDSVEEIPRERWDHRRFYDSDPSACGQTYG